MTTNTTSNGAVTRRTAVGAAVATLSGLAFGAVDQPARSASARRSP